MANKIVKDSKVAIYVKEVQVLASGGNVANLPAINQLVNIGAVSGLVGDTPRKGEDGAYYATVDTMALVRIDGVTVAFTDKQAVYSTAAGVIANASATGSFLIGYADRAKSAASAPLWVQLVPRATGAVA